MTFCRPLDLPFGASDSTPTPYCDLHSPMSEHLWYYELLNELHGPVSTDDIQQLVADGQLAAKDRIRLESSEDWITVTDLKTLVENVASGEDEWEEITDLDDLNFTFEESSADVVRATQGSDHEAEEFDDRHAELDINAFELIGDSQDARHSAFRTGADPASEAIWLVQSLGQQHGPMTMSELLAMVKAGSLVATDQIRTQDQENWAAPESIPEVAASLIEATAGASTASSGRSKNSAADVSKSGSKRRRRPSSESAPGTTPGRKRRRKKKRSQKDQLLAEIFSDVFAEDGKVKDLSERTDLATPASKPSAAQPSAAQPSAAQPSVHPTPEPTPSMNSAMVASPAGGLTGGITDASPSSSPMSAAAAASPAARFTPPPKTKKKKGGGGGVSMPQGPVLAGIGGGLVVALFGIGAYLGWFSFLGIGVNSKAYFAEFETEFPKIMTEELPSEEWQAFRSKYLIDGRVVAKSYTGSAGTDPASAKALNKALLIIRILEYKQTDVEARAESWNRYLTL